MIGWQSIFQCAIVAVDPLTHNHQQWRLSVAIFILVVGVLTTIEFAFPTTTNYLAQDQRRPLHISIASESQLPVLELNQP